MPKPIQYSAIIVTTLTCDITAGDIGDTLQYTTYRLLAINRHLDLSQDASAPGYPAAFFKCLHWEVDASHFFLM